MSNLSLIPPRAPIAQGGKGRSLSWHRHPLLIFFLLTFGIEWLLFGMSWVTVLTSTIVGVALLALLVSYSATVATVITLMLVKSEYESAALKRRLLAWRVGLRWYLLGLLLPCSLWFCAILVFAIFGVQPSVQPSAFELIPAVLVANLGEEIGWRGFALPKLQARFDAVAASIVVGMMWSLFHLPIYSQRPLFYLIFSLLITAFSIILTWIFNRTGGSIMVTVLFHASLNISLNCFPASSATLIGTLSVMAVLAWLVAGWLIWHYGRDLTQRTTVKP